MTGRVFTLGTFGEAIEALKQGLRVTRVAWDVCEAALELYVPGGAYSDKGYTDSEPTIYVRYGNSSRPVRQWGVDQEDLLARDWRTV